MKQVLEEIKAEDRIFYDLILERFRNSFPGAPVGSVPIPCVFGSRTANLTLREINSEAVNIFGWGYCTLLALAVHDITGFPLALFTKTLVGEDWKGHATVQITDCLFLDITGLNSVENINKKYGMATNPKLVSREEYCSTIATGEHVTNPFSFIRPLEQKIVKDFAALVVKEYLSPKKRLSPTSGPVIYY